jgi:class 3 adenylate cyclase
MRLALKLSLLLAAATVLPVLVGAALTLPSSLRALRQQMNELHERAAVSLAGEADRLITEKLDALALISSAHAWSELSEPELEGLLRLIYQSTSGAGAVLLVDAGGRLLLEEVRLGTDEADIRHAPLTDADFVEVARHVPFAEALRAGSAIGPPFVLPGPDGKLLPFTVLAVSLTGRGEERWALAVALSLRPLLERSERFQLGATGVAFVVDGNGKAIAHPSAEVLRGDRDLSAHPLLGAGAEALTGAVAKIGRTGWSVVVAQDADEALRAVRRQWEITSRAVLIGLMLAFALGFTVVRVVTVPLHALQSAAHQVSEGKLDTQVMIRGRDELSQLGAAFNTMTRGLRERARLLQSFSRYVSGEIATKILSGQSDLDLKGELVEVTAVFIDVRNFTSLSEQLKPQEVVGMLNDYFEQIVEVVVAHGGVVNKFIGDAVMVVFGAPVKPPEAELHAVAAALEIQVQVERKSEERAAAGLPVARFGVGVNTGPAIAGNLGSSTRMEYTVIGDAVNLAQRLQTQAAPGEVLVAASTVHRLAGRFEVQSLGPIKVKGKEHPIEVFRVLGPAAQAPAASA